MNPLDIQSHLAFNYKNIILKHGKCAVSSRKQCDISSIIADTRIESPIVCAPMPSVNNINICRIFDGNGWFHIYHRFGNTMEYITTAVRENWKFISICIGIKEKDYALLQAIFELGIRLDCITIDVAFSYSEDTEKMIKYAKQLFPNVYLIVGNGCTAEWIKWLEDLGVDCAKIGIGNSSACRTKHFTGYASSTITDLILCKNAARKIKIMSDGGITIDENGEVWIGDVAKAIYFGADYVMSGALFKNCLDSPAIKNGYSGNASQKIKQNTKNIEGATVAVTTNCLTTQEMIELIEDSLRSSVSYSGGKKLMDIRKSDYQIIL